MDLNQKGLVVAGAKELSTEWSARRGSTRWRGAAIGLGLAVLISFAGCKSSTNSVANNRIVYITAPNSNGVLVYRLDSSTGQLSQSAGSPYPTGATPDAVYLSPGQDLLYVLNTSVNNISRYKVDPAIGALSQIPPAVSTGLTPVSMTMNSSGTCLFVADQDSFDLLVYTVDGTSGALTQVGRQTTVRTPSQILVSGNFLYVLNPALRSVLIYSIAVDSSGACTGGLQQVGPPVAVGTEPKAIAITPSGNYLYAVDSANDEVSGFSIDPNTGMLAPVISSPFLTEIQPVAMAFDPMSQFLYVANNGSSSISVFMISSDNGSLTFVNTYPVSSPTSLAVDPTGKFLLIGSQSAKVVFTDQILDGTNNTTAGGLSTTLVKTSLSYSPTAIVVRK